MKGEPEYPVSYRELKQKFSSLAADAVSDDRAEQIWRAIFQLEELKGLSDLAGLLRTDS